MGRYKTPALKTKLAKALKQNRRIPVFVVARTKRKITYNRKTRNWRSKKLDIKEKDVRLKGLNKTNRPKNKLTK